MPINDIIAGIEDRPTNTANPPEENNAPPETPQPTTMRTKERRPPFLHIQTVSEREFTFIGMVGTVFFLVSLVSYFG